MWKQILNNVNAVLLKNWALLVWFILGTLFGTFVLSCSQPEPEPAPPGGSAEVHSHEDLTPKPLF